MGIFNIFIAGPQVFLFVHLVAWIINTRQRLSTDGYMNHHYEYTFFIGALLFCLILTALLTVVLLKRIIKLKYSLLFRVLNLISRLLIL